MGSKESVIESLRRDAAGFEQQSAGEGDFATKDVLRQVGQGFRVLADRVAGASSADELSAVTISFDRQVVVYDRHRATQNRHAAIYDEAHAKLSAAAFEVLNLVG